MATSTSTSPKTSHLKSLFRNASPKSFGRGILKRRSSNKIKTPDKSTHLESSSDSGDTIPLDSLVGRLSLAQTTPLSVAARSGYRAVVAIDFGTTYSGYAYSFSSHPEDIHLMRTTQGGRYAGSASTHKIPTILLLNERAGFHSFGHDAREAYHDLDEIEAKKWLYFEKFKLELHTRKDLNMSMELESSSGQRVLATIVFGHALRFFKDSCIKELNDVSITQSSFSPDDIQWVVTVPAIWRQSAKQFMRHAAVQAGLLKADNWKQLIIALEPEAASIYCQSLHAKECALDTPLSSSGSVTAGSPSPSTGAPKYKPPAVDAIRSSVPEIDLSATGGSTDGSMRYIVADCGGGTVDVTVHELTRARNLHELHKASGGTWGSMGVDCQFEQLLTNIFGEKFIHYFVKSYPTSWLELINTFEAKKCSFCRSKQVAVSLPLPFSLIQSFVDQTGTSVRTAVLEYEREGVQWTSQGMLRLSSRTMMELFEPTVHAIVQHIQEILQVPGIKKIEYLFLVGGFAESPILQTAIQDAFRSLLRVVIPQDVSLTILKGAVMFGHDPTVVHIRRSRFTYGVACLNRFIPGKHPKELKITREYCDWCSGVFDAFVYADQAISLGYTVTRSYTVAEGSRQSTIINLYASEDEVVQYINDPGCVKVGHLEFGFPYDLKKSAESREIILSMVFGETEISAKAMDCISGQTASASFNFLSK